MKKTIETIVMGLTLATTLGCGDLSNADSDYVSCTPTQDESYKVDYLYCENKGGSYSCTQPKNIPDSGSNDDYCSCYCNQPSKEPKEKGW